MPLRKNTATINEQAELLGSLWDGGTLEIYSGTQPGDPNSAATGTLLVTITIPNPAFGAASGGVVTKAGTWSDTAVATATAGYARFISADTLKTMDIPVSNIPGSGMLLINLIDITTGNTVTVISLTITEPSS